MWCVHYLLQSNLVQNVVQTILKLVHFYGNFKTKSVEMFTCTQPDIRMSSYYHGMIQAVMYIENKSNNSIPVNRVLNNNCYTQ